MESAFGYLGLGTGGYLGLYFGGMVAASLYDLIRRRNDPYYVSIGASGAVSAVLFTSIFLDPWGKILFFAVLPVPGIVFGVIYLALAASIWQERRGIMSIITPTSTERFTV